MTQKTLAQIMREALDSINNEAGPSRRSMNRAPNKAKAQARTLSQVPTVPKMRIPGCKITMQQGWRDTMGSTVKMMGYYPEAQGYGDGSTTWQVVIGIDDKFNIKDFEQRFRANIDDYQGWMDVDFFDIGSLEENHLTTGALSLSEELAAFRGITEAPKNNFQMTIPWEFEVQTEDGFDYVEKTLGLTFDITGEDRSATYDDPAESAELENVVVHDAETGEDITDRMSEEDMKKIEQDIWEHVHEASKEDAGDYRDDYRDDYAASRAEDSWRGDRF